MVLGVFNLNLAPLIAGAGIAAVAVGLGAQSLVKDCIAGFFIILEDQFGVGDETDLGQATGTVEAVTLRSTSLRGGDGTLWSIPNGAIVRVGNQSKLWSKAVLDVTVWYAADVDEALVLMQRVATEVCAPPRVRGRRTRTARGARGRTPDHRWRRVARGGAHRAWRAVEADAGASFGPEDGVRVIRVVVVPPVRMASAIRRRCQIARNHPQQGAENS